jgi:hypothetical protein
VGDHRPATLFSAGLPSTAHTADDTLYRSALSAAVEHIFTIRACPQLQPAAIANILTVVRKRPLRGSPKVPQQRGIQLAVDKSSEGLRRHSGRPPLLNSYAVVIWFLVIVSGVAFWALLVPAVAPVIVSLVHHILQAQVLSK